MKLVEASVRYPVSVIVVVLLCVIFGVISLLRIPVQMIPTLDRPRITVQTPYPGAGPLEVEEEITDRQEELLNTVEGLRKMTSISSENRAALTLEYDWGVDKNVARLDVSEKLAAVRNIPDDAEESIIQAANSDAETPIGFVVMLSEGELNDVRPLAEDSIWPRFQRVEGVGQVWFFGGEENEVHVDVDLAALAARGLSVAGLHAALLGENRNIKAGQLRRRQDALRRAHRGPLSRDRGRRADHRGARRGRAGPRQRRGAGSDGARGDPLHLCARTASPKR